MLGAALPSPPDPMHLIKRTTLEAFCRKHPELTQPLSNWAAMVQAAAWTNSDHLKRSAQFEPRCLPNDRVIFNILNNRFRLVCAVRYADQQTGSRGTVFIKFIGTHAEYDRIDPITVEWNG